MQPPYPPPYPHYPQPYPQPPRRRNRFILPGAALIILACVAWPFLAHAFTPAAAIATLPAISPTPRATLAHIDNTALYAKVNGAQLGGPLDQFTLTYGAPASADAAGDVWNATIAGAHVQLLVTSTRPGDSRDSLARAVIIDITGAGPTWSSQRDAAIVAAFLPGDAQLVRITPTGEHIYTSRQLANSLAPGVFTNAAGAQLPPGTFSWQCATDQESCEIGFGTNG